MMNGEFTNRSDCPSQWL